MNSVYCVQKKRLLSISLFLILLMVMPLAALQSAQANSKYAAIVIDANNGTVLYESYANSKRYPASLTKMMTLYMLFEALESGRVSKNDRIRFTAHSAGQPPSKLGIGAGNSITVENAIYALVTKSANDVAAATGEFLGGSEARFAQMMTAKARQLGMNATQFRNASGLPDSNQTTTARDMATLGIALREHFPSYYKYFSTRSFSYGKRRYGNHNRLLGRVSGVDGIKTGYTRASGFNLVSSVTKGNRRIVAVVMGGKSGRSRDNHMADLIKRYLPKASSRSRGPLIASRKNAPKIVLASLPTAETPLPKPRPSKVITASAYAEEAPKRPVDEIAEVVAETPRHSGWVVQVASLPSEPEAREFLSRTVEKAGPILTSATGFTETFEKDGVIYHRVRFAGFDSKDSAWSTCSTLKKRKISCYAVAQ